jgi:hypothetical protein
VALTNAPLLATKRDARLFVDRADELARLHDAAARGLNVVLVGPPGIGKTSLLNRFIGDLEDKAAEAETGETDVLVPIRVPGRPTSPFDFLVTLSARLIGELERLGVRDRTLEMARAGHAKLEAAGLPTFIVEPRDDPESTGNLLEHLEVTKSRVDDLRGAGYRPVFIVDELDQPSVAYAVFGRMRDELWNLGGLWLVAGRPEEVVILQAPPADAFFEIKVELRPLTPDASADLVKARLKAAGRPALKRSDLEAVVTIADGTPLALLSLLRAIEGGHSLRAIADGLSEIRARLANVSAPAQRLATTLRGFYEPVGATNETLLRVTGWSPGRLRQLFHELEAADVVQRVDLPASGPGRPGVGYTLRQIETPK